MIVPILVDGNNLMYTLSGDAGDRAEVRRLTLDLTRRERVSVTVVFDGPPPEGCPSRERLGAVTVVYSGRASADDVIIRTLPRPPHARDWVVVTDDHGLTERARRAGARTRGLAEWRAKLRPSSRLGKKQNRELSASEIERWEAYFERPKSGKEGSD